MDGRHIFVGIAHGILVGLSLFGVANSYFAIRKLQGYEETTRKLAQWSNAVEHELYKTRTTQASGLAATCLSLLASSTLLTLTPYLNTWVSYSIAPAMLLAVLFARGHIKNYWTPHKVSQTTTTKDGQQQTTKQKDVGVKVPALPNLEDYREAQTKTEELLLALEYLEYSWLAACVMSGLVGYG